jgi:GTPase
VKSGFVPVVGRPNVGKSTLVNRMVGSHVAIVSTRPQTTRNAIRGVVTGPSGAEPEYQIVLVDTPGLHKPKTQLGSRLNSLAYRTLPEADVVLFVIDASMPTGPGDRLIASRLTEAGAEVIVVVNKVDKAGKASTADQLVRSSEWDFASYIPISARTGERVAIVVSEVVDRLPEGPMYYPAEVTSDQPEGLVIAEIVREKLLDRLRDELPHSLVVQVEGLEQREDGLIDVDADLIVERNSQKGIIIGQGGSLLRIAGAEARHDLERLLGNQVNLRLRVRVEKDWQQRPQLLDRLGFGSS